ncbi:MAG: hypothetical protein JWO60_1764, partial [Frankiales bacterium]|nr:hypothetical protein [Frankiales bacterium]
MDPRTAPAGLSTAAARLAAAPAPRSGTRPAPRAPKAP